MTGPRPLDNIGPSDRFQLQKGALGPLRRLEFAAFSVKSMPMTSRANGFCGCGSALRLLPPLLLALALLGPVPVSAQMFSDRPPPVPPSSIPDAPGGPALNLPPTLTQPTIVPPSIATVPPVAPPPGASTAGQAVLSLTARYGKDLPVINSGLVWRVFADKPDDNG